MGWSFSNVIFVVMEFRTIVDIPKPDFEIQPGERILFVGSCFADNIGQRFVNERFRAKVNPFGVMYNPASVLHTVEQMDEAFDTVVITLGTNHVYIEKATGEIVDNCRKRPQRLFREEELTVETCCDYLQQAIQIAKVHNPNVRVILTVSPIRYAKYGYHESQLSKSTLLLAVDRLVRMYSGEVVYFPAYEIINDELRDYRFYKSDMLHPSEQAVEYIWERLLEVYFSLETKQFLKEWKPIKEAFAHRPFNPESEEYKEFIENMKERNRELERKYSLTPLLGKE